MKRLSLQCRITLMSVLLIGITCVAMNLLLCSSGVYYMDTIADSLQGGGTVILNDGGAASFDPQLIAPNEELIIVVDGVQGRFRTTNWYITAAVTLLSGILAYFVSGRALKPLRSFTSQVEQVQLNNLADMRIDEDAISEFRQLSRSSIWLNERLSCRNSEMASSSILISARLFSCTRSTCEAKLRRGLRARPLTK